MTTWEDGPMVAGDGVRFAVQIAMRDGDTQHMFGSGQANLTAAQAFRETWADQHPDNYWTITTPDGSRDVYIRDIADVQVLVGELR
ncbi:MAG: hypothetical protein ABW022_03215 [Actinoplanes sp.]